jgi:hypothetical protein
MLDSNAAPVQNAANKMSNNANQDESRETSSDAKTWVIKTFTWENLPTAVVDLRRQTFIHEKHFLGEENLTSSNDHQGVHITVWLGDTLAGATHVMLAEESDWSHWTGTPAEQLKHAVLSSRTCVAPGARYQALFPLLFLAAMRWARLEGRSHYVGHIEPGQPPFRKMVDCQLYEHLPDRTINLQDGHSYKVVPAGGEVTYASWRCWQLLSKSLKDFVRTSLMPEEIEITLNRQIQRFYKNEWFHRVTSQSLTKNQYIKALANLHQYVRWTTRLLATIAGNTENSELRAQFLEHLAGEIDHETMLERDLEHLGADVDWITKHMSPAPDIYNFMSMQNGIAAFERDPALFLAVPLVAEGLSANLDDRFLRDLEACIKSWGMERPKHAMSFLASHIHTDGGEKGHWQAVIRTMAKFVSGEPMLQRVLTVIDAITGSMIRAYDSYVEKPDLGGQIWFEQTAKLARDAEPHWQAKFSHEDSSATRQVTVN